MKPIAVILSLAIPCMLASCSNSNSPTAPTVNYTISGTVTGKGTISPALPLSIAAGSSQSVTLIPETGSQLDSVTVNSIKVPVTNSTVQLTNITENKIVAAWFSQKIQPLNALFPVSMTGDWWKMSDGYGNFYTLTVLQSIKVSSDTLIYQIQTVEAKPVKADTLLHYFKNSPKSINYSTSFTGEYKSVFLPTEFSDSIGSFVSVNNQNVGYKIYQLYKKFQNAVALTYTAPLLTGFHQIVFANTIGPVELIDKSSDRIPPYVLDSCSLAGVITRFPK